MKAIAIGLVLAVSLATGAQASWLIPDVKPDHAVHRHLQHGYVRAHNTRTGHAVSGLSVPCQIARALGGPCGCFASEQVFGHSVRELWLADAWLKFPRTVPHAGAVAVWPHRHVALAVSGPHGGRITVRDSWATHDVSLAGLVFVEPRSVAIPQRGYRYARL